MAAGTGSPAASASVGARSAASMSASLARPPPIVPGRLTISGTPTACS